MTMATKLAAGLLVMVATAACGSNNAPAATPADPSPGRTTATASPTTTPTESAPTATAAVTIRIAGDSIDATEQRVTAKVGEPILVAVDSDRDGELHVHSSPEQTKPYRIGTSTMDVIIERPGVIDVEDHATGELVFQLEVR